MKSYSDDSLTNDLVRYDWTNFDNTMETAHIMTLSASTMTIEYNWNANGTPATLTFVGSWEVKGFKATT